MYACTFIFHFYVDILFLVLYMKITSMLYYVHVHVEKICSWLIGFIKFTFQVLHLLIFCFWLVFYCSLMTGFFECFGKHECHCKFQLLFLTWTIVLALFSLG